MRKMMKTVWNMWLEFCDEVEDVNMVNILLPQEKI